MNTRPIYNTPIASIGIFDGENNYIFLIQYWEKNIIVYCPLFCPELMSGDVLYYKLEILDIRKSNIGDPIYTKVFNRNNCVAVPNPFHFEDNSYYEMIVCDDIPGSAFEPNISPIYASITPVVTPEEDFLNNSEWIPDRDYVGGQGTVFRASNELSLIINSDTESFILRPILSGKKQELSWESFRDYVFKNFGLSEFMVSAQITLANQTDIFLTLDTGVCEELILDSGENITGTSFSIIKFSESGKLKENADYDESMYLVGTWLIYRHASEDDISTGNESELIDTGSDIWYPAIILRTTPRPITPLFFGELLAGGEIIDIKNILPEDMIISQPRIINRTIQKVINMSSVTDSKANIIQPVFFRSRELAELVIHPETNENICINLDAYKAQVDSFILKIEGITFTEIGRTNSGIVFKIYGNLLPSEVDSGIVYVLNQDAELVTTGKYTYEY